MRVLLLGINYSPELTGIGKYSGEMGEWLAAAGHEVRVITAPPYYPAWRVDEAYSPWRYRRQTVKGVQVLRCPLWVPPRPSGLKRVLHLFSFAFSSFIPALWWALRWRPDVVMVIEPPLVCAPAALLAASLGGARSWLHVQDFEVDAAFELGLLKSDRLQRLTLGMERWLMRRFSRVSTISERMLDRLGEKGVAGARRTMFPNWVDLEQIRPLEGESSLRREWGLREQDIVVLYSGNMGEKQGLEVLVEAAAALSARPDVVFLLCGEGAARERLEALARGYTNIRFKPLQPLEKLNKLLGMADIHVLPQRADAADLVLPSKLTNMMASGRPVVATASPGTQVAELVRDCGIVVAPGDSGALADAVARLAEVKEKRKALGLKARELAEELWDKERLLMQVFSSI